MCLQEASVLWCGAEDPRTGQGHVLWPPWGVSLSGGGRAGERQGGAAVGGGPDSHLRRGGGRRTMLEVRPRAERTAPPGWWGREGGCRGPRGSEAEDGWRWPRSLSPAPAEGARPWCPFRRLPAHGGLQHPQMGGQPPEPQRRQARRQGGGLRPRPQQPERCVGGVAAPCREDCAGRDHGAAGPGRTHPPAPQKRVTGTGFPVLGGAACHQAHETQISIVLPLSESVRGSH